MQPLSFLVPGFSKCGTTTLCSLLDQHPDIYIPPIKEPNFFNNDDYAERWPQYQSLFADTRGATVLGEGSTFYCCADHEVATRERIKHHYPDIKLIFIARDPINRIESSFRESHHSGPRFGFDTPYSLNEAIDQLPNILEDACFWSRFDNFRQHFPEQNIHTLFLEDLKADTQGEIAKCFRFLGVDDDFAVEEQARQLNAGTTKLYDTRLLRKIRNTAITGIPLSKVPIDIQDKVLTRLGLRQTFSEPIRYDSATRDRLLQRLEGEISKFLAYCGKPEDFWPRYYNLVNNTEPTS